MPTSSEQPILAFRLSGHEGAILGGGPDGEHVGDIISVSLLCDGRTLQLEASEQFDPV